MMDMGFNAGRFLTSKLLDYLHRSSSIPHLILSVMVFGVPVYLIAVLIYVLTGVSAFISYGFLLAFLWLAIAPYVIWKLESEVWAFLGKLKTVVKSEEEFQDFVERFDHTVYSVRAYVFGIPFAIGSDYLVFLVFDDISLPIQLIMVIFLTVLFLIAGIGFWGVVSLIRLMRWLEQLDVNINPFHPDKFGGLGFVSSLTIRVTLGFSTGSLVIPLALLATMSLHSDITIPIARVLVGTYVFFILLSFFVPTFAIHSWLLRIQRDYLEPISESVWNLFQILILSELSDEQRKKLANLSSAYGVATRMKEWPFDLAVIVQLIGSILLPVIVMLTFIEL